jgi:hypothetical protein
MMSRNASVDLGDDHLPWSTASTGTASAALQADET